MRNYLFLLLPLFLPSIAAHAGENKKGGGSCHVTMTHDLRVYHNKDIFKVHKQSFQANYEIGDGVAKGLILDQCIKAAIDKHGKPIQPDQYIWMKGACEGVFRDTDHIVCTRNK
jgi:hypothetical protein